MPATIASLPASTGGGGAVHTPAAHVSPLAQANVAPHPPQLPVSVCSSTHAEPHIV
jgi:hypothetical protein